MEYIISISSNEQADKNIALTKEILEKEFSNVKFSSVINTKPVGEGYPQRDFTNTAVSLTSRLNEDEMKDFLRSVEEKLGRTPELKKQKIVPVDLDIIIVGHQIVHKDYANFSFLRKLIAEIRPFV
ncbi:MAG: 2-amino-4-hydroxy-6-hydroxymethyldihydropteridine diphosphokinase [Paludibacteraceae bacterium]|jgi:2-amino-4-hydroxy-6-hydroxymethyldihydropteridine diphosphokinase|nr:2-amino-4-hydroxy-6-hydroxymethyldihydropteridine diphosphokinase [Bacteroidales bacterium]MBP3466313.1 2-amino-4-hydroxy-6-hydroxymethyldihydropteridine diphosphokinase [Paludibacteraceae bacterium]MBQ1835672.1 2-amino-4-hydroxy-6-hydroxymethyldihydropteridine diphosphokinase [Paludibacteraceae bacterium]MBQ2591282.1 2-amino-4-hydroxy-6-hydroxymethyldihydropteridine diphosphokinase [Paludibacteraceae bacterium]MBQ3896061.1 2-amino-4-hydroxy-6-hydroxymethyldihydropteridine diphosphokinase [P